MTARTSVPHQPVCLPLYLYGELLNFLLGANALVTINARGTRSVGSCCWVRQAFFFCCFLLVAPWTSQLFLPLIGIRTGNKNND